MLKLFTLLVSVVMLWSCMLSFGFDEDEAARCGGKKYTSPDQVCQNNALKDKCGDGFYNPIQEFCFNGVAKDKCGGKIYNPPQEVCIEGVIKNKCGDEFYDPIQEVCIEGVVFEKNHDKKFEFTDQRDGRIYGGIIIGSQVWMSENMQMEAANTRCYDDDPANCEIFGILYDWETANTICPDDWRLPSDNDWRELDNFAGYDSPKKLMAISDYWTPNNGTDEFGFAALPGGFYRGMNGYTFRQKGVLSGFWSSTSGSMSGSAHFNFIAVGWSRIDLDGLYTDNAWANVRCIKE